MSRGDCSGTIANNTGHWLIDAHRLDIPFNTNCRSCSQSIFSTTFFVKFLGNMLISKIATLLIVVKNNISQPTKDQGTSSVQLIALNVVETSKGEHILSIHFAVYSLAPTLLS